MNDRELLEMAAKAVGMPSLHDANGIYGAWVGDSEKGHWWNPLEDDGDALRLATYLCMTVTTGPCQAAATTNDGALRGHFPNECTITQPEGRAVRRVIVRAAAEIGNNMP